MHVYTGRDLQRLFGLTPATVRFLNRAGFITPVAATRAAGRGHSYAFRDLIVLRTVSALCTAGIPVRVIHRFLGQLKGWLPEGTPMSRLSFTASGARLKVRDGDSLWDPRSGQYALGLEPKQAKAHVLPMARSDESSDKSSRLAPAAHAHFLLGCDLEASDAAAARAAYEACLAGDCTHLEARINLGRLLHLEGRHGEAEAVYGGSSEPNAHLYYNRAVLLEDVGREQEALAAYREALIHDPGMADAHYNLSLLQERAGDTQAAFRHLLAYRRLTQGAS